MGFRDEIDKFLNQMRQSATTAVNYDLNRKAPGVQSVASNFNTARANVGAMGQNLSQGFKPLYQTPVKQIGPTLNRAANEVGYARQNLKLPQAVDFLARRGESNIRAVGDIATGMANTGQVKPFIQGIKGFGTLAAGVFPATAIPTLGSEIMSSGYKQPTTFGRRVMAGASEQLGQTKAYGVADKKTNLPFIGQVDIAKGLGSMAAFPMRPENKLFFKFTESILPAGSALNGFKKWAAITGTRGAIEDIVLSIPDLPENATATQKAQIMAKAAGFGAASELLVRGGGDLLTAGAKKAMSNVELSKAYDELQTFKRRWMTPTTFTDTVKGEKVTAPMWKYKMWETNRKLQEKIKPGMTIEPLSKAQHDANLKLGAQSTLSDISPITTKASENPDSTGAIISNISHPYDSIDEMLTALSKGKGKPGFNLENFKKLYNPSEKDLSLAKAMRIEVPTQEQAWKLVQKKSISQLPSPQSNPILEKIKPTEKLEQPQSVIPAKQQIGKIAPTLQTQVKPDGGLIDNQVSSSPPIIQDPIQTIIQALQEAKPIRGAQEALYSKARSQQAAKLAGVGSRVSGEQGYFAQLGQLKGPLPRAQFEGIRNKIKQTDIDSLFNMIEQKTIFSPFEKVNAKTALSKLLGAEGGTVPTKSELKLLSEVFPQEMIDAIQSNRTTLQKLMSLGVNGLNVPRSIMATADLSAPLRQGIFLVGRPKQWAPAFKAMFKYAGSEDAYKGLNESIQARPTYKLMRENNLALSDLGSNLSSREEAIMSNLPEKIPVFGRLARGSNRAYSGFLNKLRADTFDDMYKSATKQGLTADNPKLVADIANFVNTATGRGNLGKFQKAAEILNATLFAPRLVASRVNLLNPVYYATLDPFVRKEALKSLFSFVGLGGTVLGLSKLAGADVETDPTSSDFGKIKIGNTRYDIWGGFQQYIKLAAQLGAGQIKSSTTGKIMTLGEGYKPMTRKDILVRFFESKESPVASFITGLLTGQTGTGEPMNIPSEAISRFIPLLAQDLYDLYNEYGPKGLLMGAPGVFGVGSQTYGKTEFVTGKNQIGQPTSQIRPLQDLPTKIGNAVFGQKPLGSTSSWNAETYYNQLLKMPKAEAAAKWNELVKTNPELVKKMTKIIQDRKSGVTVQNEQLKLKGVQSGDRAVSIAKEFKKLKTPKEKAALWNDYVKKGIITKDVAKQLQILLKQ